MAKDLVDMYFQAAVLSLDVHAVTKVLMFGKQHHLLIGTTDESYQHVILEKTMEVGLPKKVNLFMTLIELKATIRYYADRKDASDGSIIKDAMNTFDTSICGSVTEKDENMTIRRPHRPQIIDVKDESMLGLMDDEKRNLNVTADSHIHEAQTSL